jgi:hypothetical protein
MDKHVKDKGKQGEAGKREIKTNLLAATLRKAYDGHKYLRNDLSI